MLRNLGPKSCEMLQAAGITSREQLVEIGPVVTYAAVKQIWPAASLNLLWALAAGLEDRNWQDLSEAEKQQLRQQLKSMERC